MSDEDRQAIELADELSALLPRYPDIPPLLRDELLALSDRFRASPDAQLRRDGMRVIGQTHLAIREHQDATDSRVAGVQEDMAGMQAEQDAATALIAAATEAIAGLVEVHTAKRLRKLEQRADDMASTLRSIEDTIAPLLRLREHGEATAPHTD